MKVKIGLVSLFLLAVSAFSACTLNVNQPGSNAGNTTNNPRADGSAANANGQKLWSVVVCSSRSKAVTLSAGATENDGEIFATWQENSGRRTFDLPARLQNLPKIYLKGSASDKNQVEMCVLYDGRPKKRVEFDDNEDVMVSSTDVDDQNKCRCSS